MRKVHIDFESRSRVDIWEAGAYVYASAPSTEILCLAYAVDNGPVKIIRYSNIQAHPFIGAFEELTALATATDTLFYAHNALFEQLIWKFQLVPKGLPPLPIMRWRCTAAKALAHGLPKALKDVARAVGTSEQKDMGGRAVMLKVCKPKKDGGWVEDSDLMRQLEDYCAQDVETEREIDNKLPELSPVEQYVWFEDQLINQRGIAVDVEAVDKCLELIEQETAYLKAQLYELTAGQLDSVSRRNATLDYLQKNGVVLPDFTKKTVEWALASGKIPARIAQVLRIRQQLGLTSTAKYLALKGALCEDNRLRDTLVYHSASTGRWGGKLVQLQNLPKGTEKDTDAAVNLIKTMPIEELRFLYGNIMGLLSSCIRGMFIAPEGHDIIVADYSAIEARVLMWLAGQEDAVKMFAEGADIYVEMASRIGNNASRQLGKQAVLGCGFGMGSDRFMETCLGYNIEIDRDLAERAVSAYRTTFSKVPAFWSKLESAFKTAIASKKTTTCGRIKCEHKGDFLYCILPSGRALAYHKAKIVSEKISYYTTHSTTKKYLRSDAWGGKLVENCLTADTKVVTIKGVKRIDQVKKGDEVWDGENWVKTDGVILRGVKPTGVLAGIRLTQDHLILAGNSWKKAIALDENTWQEALKSGRSLADYGYSYRGMESEARLHVSVIAETAWLSVRDKYLEALYSVGSVAIKMQAKKNGNIKVSCFPIYSAYGYTDTPEWFQGAITRLPEHIKTTVAVVLKSILCGWKTVLNFWNGQKHSQTGSPHVLTWNELTMTEIIPRKTCALPKEKLTAGIDETRNSYNGTVKKYAFASFGKKQYPNGKAETAFNTISTEDEPQKKLWKFTGLQEEVYDLLNCGPNNRFTVISADGPVIVHNCVQAAARDILAEAILRAEKAGYKIVLTVHDELVAEIPEGKGSVEDFIKIITTLPAWAEGCPVSAEGWRGKRYKK